MTFIYHVPREHTYRIKNGCILLHWQVLMKSTMTSSKITHKNQLHNYVHNKIWLDRCKSDYTDLKYYQICITNLSNIPLFIYTLNPKDGLLKNFTNTFLENYWDRKNIKMTLLSMMLSMTPYYIWIILKVIVKKKKNLRSANSELVTL